VVAECVYITLAFLIVLAFVLQNILHNSDKGFIFLALKG
jgi:hypothetical protein